MPDTQNKQKMRKTVHEKRVFNAKCVYSNKRNARGGNMRTPRVDGNFFLALLINMIFNLEGTIPAWILLVLHFIIGLSIKWFWIALGIWMIGLMLWMWICGCVYGWAAKCGNTPDPPKKNVNPYSVKSSQNRDEHR